MTGEEIRARYQQWFDTALTNLRAQGRPSVDAYGFCQYRSPDGCRCAIGWLIPDGDYEESMEGRVVGDPLVRLIIDQASAMDTCYLEHMQSVLHDNYVRASFKEWSPPNPEGSLPYPEWLEEKAAAFAAFHGLTYIPLTSGRTSV